MTQLRTRRGPLRQRAAVLPDRSEVLVCGHGYQPDPREGPTQRAARWFRRCPECEYDAGEHRAAFYRERARRRYAAQKEAGA